MSLILDFAVKAYNYVSSVISDDNESKSASKEVKNNKSKNNNTPVKTNTSKVNSCTNPTGTTNEKIGDTVEIKQNTTVQTKKVTQANASVKTQTKSKNSASKKNSGNGKTEKSVQTLIEEAKARILQKCKKFGISYQEAEGTILSQMKFSYNEYKNMSPEEKLATLCAIDGALGLYIIDKSKRRIHSDADKATVIGQTARNIKEAKELGAIDEIEDFEEGVGDINKELDGKINEHTSEEEYAKILEESRRAFRASIEMERIAEIKKCNGNKAKIAEINKQFDARLQAFERQRQLEFAAAHGAKEARMSVYLRDADDYAEAHEVAMNPFNGLIKTKVADSFDHEFEMNTRRRYYEWGDPVSAEQYAKAIEAVTQNMSLEALTKFEKDTYEFRKKVENGEINAPYMSEEDFTKESVAIGVGITNNKNMSSAEKAELLNKWDKDALQFSDYCYVKEEFNKAAAECVNANPNSVQGLISVKQILIEKYNNNIEKFPRVWEKRNKQNLPVKTKADENTLKTELKTMSVEKVKQRYKNSVSMHQIAKIILENDIEYKDKLEEILDYLNCFSGTDIGIKIAGSSTATISKIVMAFPDKADDILDIVAPTMCFSGKQAVEHIVEEGKKNAAA